MGLYGYSALLYAANHYRIWSERAVPDQKMIPSLEIIAEDVRKSVSARSCRGLLDNVLQIQQGIYKEELIVPVCSCI